MEPITPSEYGQRLDRLQQAVADADLDCFIVTARESIFYLTGRVYDPLERPFFMLVRPHGATVLLVPRLEREHMLGAINVRHIESYWEYPARRGERWQDRLTDLLRKDRAIGVEASLRQEIAGELSGFQIETPPLIAEGNDDALAAGMVISIEPGIYLPEIGGVRHSDTFLVTEDGHECLTRSPTRLDDLTLTGWRPYRRLVGGVLQRSFNL